MGNSSIRLLGFIVSLSSTAVAITGESEMQRDALLLSFFGPRYKKAAPWGRLEFDREEV